VGIIVSGLDGQITAPAAEAKKSGAESACVLAGAYPYSARYLATIAGGIGLGLLLLTVNIKNASADEQSNVIRFEVNQVRSINKKVTLGRFIKEFRGAHNLRGEMTYFKGSTIVNRGIIKIGDKLSFEGGEFTVNTIIVRLTTKDVYRGFEKTMSKGDMLCFLTDDSIIYELFNHNKYVNAPYGIIEQCSISNF
jgi:hypothetical protein